MNDSIRKQKVIVDIYPSSKIATAFSTIASRITSETVSSEPKGNIQFFWKKLLRLGGEAS